MGGVQLYLLQLIGGWHNSFSACDLAQIQLGLLHSHSHHGYEHHQYEVSGTLYMYHFPNNDKAAAAVPLVAAQLYNIEARPSKSRSSQILHD